MSGLGRSGRFSPFGYEPEFEKRDCQMPFSPVSFTPVLKKYFNPHKYSTFWKPELCRKTTSEQKTPTTIPFMVTQLRLLSCF